MGPQTVGTVGLRYTGNRRGQCRGWWYHCATTHGERRTHRGDGSHAARPSAEAFCGEERRPFLRWGQMRLCLRSPTKLWLPPGTILRTCVLRGYAGRMCLFLVVAVEVAVPSPRRLDPPRSFMRGPGRCNKRRVTEFSSSSVLPTPGAATRRRLNPLSLRGREREPPAAAGGMAVRPGPRPTHDVMENLPSFKGTHDPCVCSPPGSIPCAVRAAAVARPSASRVVGIRGCGRTGAGARDVARAPGQQQLAGGWSGSSDPALAPFPGSRIHAVPRRCAGCTTACCWRVRILTR